MSTATVSPALNAVDTESNYLNSSHGLKSWLLTQDHKRIALLLYGLGYLLSHEAYDYASLDQPVAAVCSNWIK